MLLALPMAAEAQNDIILIDTIADPTVGIEGAEPIFVELDSLSADSITATGKQKKAKRDWNTWRPDVKKALWLAIVTENSGNCPSSTEDSWDASTP